MNVFNETGNSRSGQLASGEPSLLPCSQAQTRFWYEEQLSPETSARNVFARWRLEGDVNAVFLDKAWNLLVARHASLRTRFLNDDGEPKAIIEPSVDFHVRELDLTLLSEPASSDEAERIALLEAQTPFDLTTAPLVRVLHVRLRDRASILMVTAHHIVADGWSFGILARELGTIVAALERRAPLDLPTLPIGYGTYVERERTYLSSPGFAARADALAATLKGYTRTELPPDFPRPAVQSAHGDIASLLLDRSLSDALAQLARERGCTLFMVAYAALLVLLRRESHSTDLTITTQVTGRDDVDVENVVGTFVNTLPLRTAVPEGARFSDLLECVRDGVSDALELRDVPLGALIELVKPTRDLSRSALCSINFIFQRSFITNARYGSFALVDLPSRSVGAMYDLCFFMVERPEGWRFSCEYNTDLFAPSTIASLLERYRMVLEQVTADSDASLDSLLPDARRAPAAAPVVPLRPERAPAASRVERKMQVRALIVELLESDGFGDDDDLFARGFHSLLAMRFLARLKKLRGVDLPLRTLFEFPTISGLAERIDALDATGVPADAREPIALLNPGGTQEPLFYFHGDLTADGLYTRRLAALIGADQPIYAIAPHGTSGLPAFATVEEMAADYLARIRAIRPAGPYRLGGYCIGGLIAYEIARTLAAEGESADRLILVNSVALPKRAIAAFDRLIRSVGLNVSLNRKIRARLCYNLAWVHAAVVSNPLEMVKLIAERFSKLRNRQEPVWQMSDYPEDRRDEAERAVAYVNAASFTYHRKPYDGDVTLIWGSAQDVRGEHPAAEWRSVTRNARLLEMNGGRAGPLNSHVADFAVALRDALHG